MGSLAYPAAGSTFEAQAPRRNDTPAQVAQQGAATADSEARRVLALLRRTLDRLPE